MSNKDLYRWSGLSLMVAGLLLTLGTLIHPSNEAPQTIIDLESRLIAGHWLLTFYVVFFLLGLSGIYFFLAEKLGRFGLLSFISLFFGMIFYAVSSDYGFNAPVLAKLAVQTLDAINAYPPVIIMDGLFVVLLLIGFVLFGTALLRSRLFPSWMGISIILGWPIFMVASAVALYVYEPIWLVAILGAACLSAGLIGVGYNTWKCSDVPELQTSEAS